MPTVTPAISASVGNRIQSPYNPNFNKNISQINNQNVAAVPVLSENEEFVINAFERFTELYNNAYTEEHKQKDFNHKILSLYAKLKIHDIKPNLLNILIEFIHGKYKLFKFYFSL